MKKIWLVFLSVAVLLSGCKSTNRKVAPAIAEDSVIEKKVENVLKGMSLEEKAGQMVQITISEISDSSMMALDPAKLEDVIGRHKVGSILNVMNDQAQPRAFTADIVSQIQKKSMESIGIPCIFGLDMIHGASYLSDATFFPQEINLAATFDRAYPSHVGRVTAYETRAAMVPWVFSPVMDLGRDPRWPRMWESFGEDPYLSAEMARSMTLAYQGNDPNHIDREHVAVSIKHFMAYGVPFTGKDRTPAYVPEYELRDKYFRPFRACLRSGALTMMANSATINGIPTHANKKLLTGWVKEELGWDGMIVSDWADINNLYQRDHVAADKREAVKIGIDAGIDMIMDPYDASCTDVIVELVKSGDLSISRVDDAVRRILRLKFRLGLFENPTWNTSGYTAYNSAESEKISYDAAVESEVLLKNEDGLLPLPMGTRILVTGPNANSLRTLNGGWTYTWQGIRADEFRPQYNTIYEALAQKFGEMYVKYVPGVSYVEDGNWQDEDASRMMDAVRAAYFANVIVVCVGENTYCETPGNLSDLNLSSNQKELVRQLAATGRPIVLVLNGGRPRIIGDIEPLAKAVVDVMLPGNRGGDALAALLSGEENFSGKLPFTYSKHINSLHTYDYKVAEHRETMDGAYNYDAVMDVQWPFGYGLSYTSFEYSDFNIITPSEFTDADTLRFQIKVRNTGNRPGKESVLLYYSDEVASVMPEVRRLTDFTKVSLRPGEARMVSFAVPATALAFVRADGKWVLEEGDFRFSCGGRSLKTRCTATRVWETPYAD